jgi:hypothetical protein
MRAHRRNCVCHNAGTSDSTSMRARTSSLRLLSCVEVASIVAGQLLARSALAPWKALTVTPKVAGSPPTSFRDTSRL